MRTLNVAAVLLSAACSVLVGCSDPERDSLARAESLYGQGKPSEALKVAIEVQGSGKHRERAAALIAKISAQYLVITSDPAGLEVFLSPISALDELPKDSDSKTPLAKSFGERGVPRAIGCTTFLMGETPVAVPRPAAQSAIAVLRKATEGGTVATKRAFRGDIQVRGSPNFRVCATGLSPEDASIILWDDANKKSGQVQMLSSGKLVAVAVIQTSGDGKTPVHAKLTPEELYESLAGKSLDIK
jgi:hypothetical protein